MPASSSAASSPAECDGQVDAHPASKPAMPPGPATLKVRTSDVQSDAKSFQDMLLPAPLIHSLAESGFHSPSPVQQAAIPLGLVGSDLIVQAKSGTGKTVVFSVICLERVKKGLDTPQVRGWGPRGWRAQLAEAVPVVGAYSACCRLSCAAGPGAGTHPGDRHSDRRGG